MGLQGTAKSSLNFWPVRVHEKPSFRYIPSTFFQKKPRVRKILVSNSGAGNGCANFMDAWKNASVLQEKPCP